MKETHRRIYSIQFVCFKDICLISISIAIKRSLFDILKRKVNLMHFWIISKFNLEALYAVILCFWESFKSFFGHIIANIRIAICELFVLAFLHIEDDSIANVFEIFESRKTKMRPQQNEAFHPKLGGKKMLPHLHAFWMRCLVLLLLLLSCAILRLFRSDCNIVSHASAPNASVCIYLFFSIYPLIKKRFYRILNRPLNLCCTLLIHEYFYSLSPAVNFCFILHAFCVWKLNTEWVAAFSLCLCKDIWHFRDISTLSIKMNWLRFHFLIIEHSPNTLRTKK